jgi:hypothetical protein
MQSLYSSKKFKDFQQAYRTGKDIEALKLISSLSQKFPNEPYLHVLLGELLLGQGNDVAGLQSISKSLELNRFCLRAMWWIGFLSEENNKLDSAIVVWKKILKIGRKKYLSGSCAEPEHVVDDFLNSTRFKLWKANEQLNNELSSHYQKLYYKYRGQGISCRYDDEV